MNKIEQGAESFKQFVVDEYNQLETKYKDLQETKGIIERKFNNLQTTNHELTKLLLKRTQENENMSKKLSTIGNVQRIQLLKNENEKLIKSHDDVNRHNNYLKERLAEANQTVDKLRQINTDTSVQLLEARTVIAEQKKTLDNLCDGKSFLRNEIENLKKVNSNLSKSNTNHILINGQLIDFLNSIGYVVLNEVKETDLKENLKNILSKKYHVEEVKPEIKLDPTKFNPETLIDMLKKGFGKDFEVHVIGGDENSQNVIRDLFGNLEPTETSKKNNNRDNKGRFTKK